MTIESHLSGREREGGGGVVGEFNWHGRHSMPSVASCHPIAPAWFKDCSKLALLQEMYGGSIS